MGMLEGCRHLLWVHRTESILVWSFYFSFISRILQSFVFYTMFVFSIEQGSTNFFCGGWIVNILGFASNSPCCDYSTLSLWCKISPRHCVSEWGCGVLIKLCWQILNRELHIIFLCCEIFFFFWFSPWSFRNVKTLLTSHRREKQVVARWGPWAAQGRQLQEDRIAFVRASPASTDPCVSRLH